MTEDNPANQDSPADNDPPVYQAEGMPLSKVDEKLLECFASDVAAQANRMDDLAKQLITLNIAVPGVYAAVLKLLSGGDQAIGNVTSIGVSFVLWLLALGLSLACLLPQKREVDPDDLLAIQRYFSDSASAKLKYLVWACISSFFGIVLAVLSIFI